MMQSVIEFFEIIISQEKAFRCKNMELDKQWKESLYADV